MALADGAGAGLQLLAVPNSPIAMVVAGHVGPRGARAKQIQVQFFTPAIVPLSPGSQGGIGAPLQKALPILAVVAFGLGSLHA